MGKTHRDNYGTVEMVAADSDGLLVFMGRLAQMGGIERATKAGGPSWLAKSWLAYMYNLRRERWGRRTDSSVQPLGSPCAQAMQILWSK